MNAQIIDGKAIGEQVKQEVAARASAHVAAGRIPGLAVVLVGDDPASQTYVNNKEKTCRKLGMHSVQHHLPDTTSEAELLDLVHQLNNDPRIHGILVQHPMPKQINEFNIFAAIDPAKDVDGFNPISVGRLHIGLPALVPCTPLGVMRMLKETGINLQGARAVVVGRSNIVGKPMATLLTAANATVTVCHSRTRDLPGVCREADVLVAAIGKARLVTADFVKPGAVVIDVGMNRLDGKLCGDVDFEAAATVAGWITPVPGGVGPMTIAMLMQNTLTAAEAIWDLS